MRLIGTYRSPGYDALAEAALGFYGRRVDLHRPGIAFGHDPAQPAKVSTDISLVAIDRTDPEAHGLAELILRGVSAGLQRYLSERPLLLEVCPERSLFVNPIFNLQHYAPGKDSAAGTATGPPARRRQNRSGACSPGFFTSTRCPMVAPSSTGRTTTSRPSGASC